MAGVLAAGRITQDDMAQFVRISGVRRYATAKALTQLQHEDDIAYRQLTTSAKLKQLQTVEDQLTAPRTGRAAKRPAITAEQWEATTASALTEMRATVQDAATASSNAPPRRR